MAFYVLSVVPLMSWPGPESLPPLSRNELKEWIPASAGIQEKQ